MSICIVTGGAGFIGSNLSAALAEKDWTVRIVDNFSTGKRENVARLLESRSDRVSLHEGSITDLPFLQEVFAGAEVVFHEAAIPSVQKSIDDPARSNLNNITGTLNVLIAARDNGVRRVVYAASSSAYGDTPTLPKVETMPTQPLSPYALQKLTGEHYCRLFTELFDLDTIALRYFNVFGPQQDPASQYAAVIPKFITRMLEGTPPVIFGDGTQSRDFSHIDNVIRANVLAAAAPSAAAGRVFNIACGERMDLNALVGLLNDILGTRFQPVYDPPKSGDVKHSLADISLARDLLGYTPFVTTRDGLSRTVDWYRTQS